MHERPLRPAPPVASALFALVTLVVTSFAAPAAGQSPLWAGDPDIPALGLADQAMARAAHPGARSVIRGDLDRILSAPTLRLWLVGGAAALATHGKESPDRAEAALGQGLIDGPADLGNLYGSGATLAGASLLALGVGHFAGNANLRSTGSEMTRSLVYTSVLVTSLKHVVNRTRPNGAAYSFPSGHTALAFAMAPVLARHYGLKAAIPAYALGVATGLGRMEDRKHYLSDVLVGAAIGLSIGRAVTGPAASAAGPQFLVGPGGAQVELRF